MKSRSINILYLISAFVLISLMIEKVKSQAKAWEQCGGINYEGPITCEFRFECVYKTEYFSQCEPVPIPSPEGNENDQNKDTAVKSQASSVVENWRQCGGNGFTGITTCEDNFKCIYYNDYYSQCEPENSNQNKKNNLEENSAKAQVWKQCGGIGYEGSTECVENAKCIYYNEYYSQCEPLNNQNVGQGSANDLVKSNQEPALLWKQCGGIGYEGSTECVENANCIYYNEYYSQCEPSEPKNQEVKFLNSGDFQQQSNNNEAEPGIPVWGQCDGAGWVGSKKCVDGAFCSYTNQWYSQCIPTK